MSLSGLILHFTRVMEQLATIPLIVSMSSGVRRGLLASIPVLSLVNDDPCDLARNAQFVEVREWRL